jgi:hypothetical protein
MDIRTCYTQTSIVWMFLKINTIFTYKKNTFFKRILIALLNVSIDCANGDKLIIFNDDKKNVLLDYCYNLQDGSKAINYAMFMAKYLLLRLETSTSK